MHQLKEGIKIITYLEKLKINDKYWDNACQTYNDYTT